MLCYHFIYISITGWHKLWPAGQRLVRIFSIFEESLILILRSSLLNPKSSILGPQYLVLSPQSSVLSPQSSVLSPQSFVGFETKKSSKIEKIEKSSPAAGQLATTCASMRELKWQIQLFAVNMIDPVL